MTATDSGTHIRSMPSQVRLLCSDVDGTLVGNPEASRRFKETWEGLPALRRPLLAYNSGRLVDDTRRFFAEEEILPVPDYAIGGVGTQIYDERAGRMMDDFYEHLAERVLYPPFHLLTGVGQQAFVGWNFLIRKAGHVFWYGLTCGLLYRQAGFELWRRRAASWSAPAAFLALASTMLVAGLDEWHQTTIPSRTGTLSDVLLDSAAGLAALALIFLRSAPGLRRHQRRAGLPEPSRTRALLQSPAGADAVPKRTTA
jgi:VanZ family protein